MKKIGFIGPYRGTCDLAMRIAQQRGIPIDCSFGVLEEVFPVAERMFTAGIEVIVACYPSSQLLTQKYGKKIIEVHISNYAFLSAALDAREYDRKIAFISFGGEDRNLDIPLVERALDVKICTFEMVTVAARDTLVREIAAQGIHVIISTALGLRKTAAANGIALCLIKKDSETLTQAILTAKALVDEREQLAQFKNYIYKEPDAVLAADNRGNISIFNPAMCQLTGLQESYALGLPLEMLAQHNHVLRMISQKQRLFLLNNKQYIVTQFTSNTPIEKSGQDIYKVIEIETPFARRQVLKGKAARDTFRGKYHFEDIVGESPAILSTVSTAKQYAKVNSTILLYGETGVGKELFAQSIHNASFSNGPFIAINCAALPDNLLESELYGYEEGAFTGARSGGKMGLFELASGGTLFLDEIGEISLAAQARLLRSIQERQIIRLGGTSAINVNCRIISATNRDLKAAVENGTFRSDLFYRLNVLQLRIPPLRERVEDIEILARKLQTKYLNSERKQVTIDDHLLNRLTEYEWPGNVRELEAFLERLIVTSKETTVTRKHFESVFSRMIGTQTAQPVRKNYSKEASRDFIEVKLGTLEDMTYQLIQEVYRKTDSSTGKSCKFLGISRATLWRKLKQSSNNTDIHIK